MTHLDALIDAPGPKKLLSIDGGGIRGMIAIEFLARIEQLLRERFERPDLVLCQYFDYVGGTSTGAIIAALVSLGYSTDDIRGFYRTGARTMFAPNALGRIGRRTTGPLSVIMSLVGMLVYKAMYTQVPLETQIKVVLGDPPPDRKSRNEPPLTTLGTEKLQTLLMLVTRNASTDSPWPISNNPRAIYNLHAPGRATNLDMPLWQLIRASTAAPVFFPPEKIHVPGGAKPFMFMDGGVTVYNNPSFQLFLMATLPAYKLTWRTGEDQMLLISAGTGLCESANLNLGPREMNLLYNVQSTPAALIRAATVEQDVLCRVFGRARPGCSLPEIDSEIGDLVSGEGLLAQRLFRYARYNVELSDSGLRDLGLYDPDSATPGIEPQTVQPIDDVDHLEQLGRVGSAAAQRCVSIDDFEGFLDAGALRPALPPPQR